MLKDELMKRDRLIMENKPKNVKYFNIEEYLDLDLYSTYIFITPRNIGKSTSCRKLAIDVYEATGEYTVWMRSNESELKETIKDFAETHDDFWPEHFKVVGNSVIDNQTGNLVIKFVALSTTHNFASIKGDGCFGIIYDEFLPRTTRTQPSFKSLADFIKTLERDKLLTVILIANATTLNSEILNSFDIWKDVDKQTNLEKRLYYERIREWDGAPDVGSISTAYQWASSSDGMLEYMFSSDFLKDDNNSVIPLSRLHIIQWIMCYRLNGEYLTVGLDSENRYVITSGIKDDELAIFNLTQIDNFTPSDNVINCVDVFSQLNYLFNAMRISNVIFTNYELRDNFYKFVLQYLPRKI